MRAGTRIHRHRGRPPVPRAGSIRPAPRRAAAPAAPTATPVAAAVPGGTVDLWGYETQVRQQFDRIEPTLRTLSAMQHSADFADQAADVARRELGIELPAPALERAWVTGLDLRTLYAHAVFATFRRLGEDFFTRDPLGGRDTAAAEQFFRECGFHRVALASCADGRLAHVVSYVLRLPYAALRRKASAGALFDVEESVGRWVETEYRRVLAGEEDDTRYLKMAVYHFSGSDPDGQGCAAHGSDVRRAATAALERLEAFEAAVENGFCCGAGIDRLLLGVDTDTDALRVHIPDAEGRMDIDRWVDSDPSGRSRGSLDAKLAAHAAGGPPQPGMQRFIERLLANNADQRRYVNEHHGGQYADIGHAERFIGVGVGFEEVQLRNLTFFAYADTVEEGAPDLDVGVHIFERLNVARGLPVPVVIRFNYDADIPGSRERAVARCRRMDAAIRERYGRLADQGLLHTCMTVRNTRDDAPPEWVGASTEDAVETGA